MNKRENQNLYEAGKGTIVAFLDCQDSNTGTKEFVFFSQCSSKTKKIPIATLVEGLNPVFLTKSF